MERAFSVYLDVLRFAAAIFVFLGHAPKYLNYTLWQLSGLSDEAVIIFFVLSGFVIAYVIFERQEGAWEYAVKRFTRVYSVALPALLFTVVAYYAAKMLSPDTMVPVDREMGEPITAFLAALFFLNQSWAETQVFSNLPYWSLAFEVQYYLCFGVIVFMTGRLKWGVLAVLLLIMGPSIVLYFPLWLSGVGCYFLCQRFRLSKGQAGGGALISFIGAGLLCLNGVQEVINAWGHTVFPASLYDLVHPNRHKFLADYALAVMVVLHLFFASLYFVGHTFSTGAGDKLIRTAASHTFSLYLFHMPLMYLMQALFPFSTQPVMAMVSIVVLTPLIIWVFSIYIEKTKHIYADRLTVWARRGLGMPQR